MKERPILFSGEMIRAILDGRKVQTRRVIKPQPPSNCDTPVFDQKGRGWFYDGLDDNGNCLGSWPNNDTGLRCPYGKPGDRLWVRETWQALITTGDEYLPWSHTEKTWRKQENVVEVGYRADGEGDWVVWCPSIFMPRWASRITLEVTAVRAEQVQDISEQDAIAEGIKPFRTDELNQYVPAPVEQFKALWNSINAKRHYGWSKNPAVWVVEFKRVEE